MSDNEEEKSEADRPSNNSSFLEYIKRKLFSILLKNTSKLKGSVTDLIIEDNNLCKDNSNIINNLLKFNDCTVKDIMIPRTEICAVNITIDKQQLIDFIVSSQHTRVPVYKVNLDNIVGFIHIKDILANLNTALDFNNILHQVLFVPPSMKAINLFLKMQSSHVHVAVVLDEYGGTEGLVTMADIIEEIVGSIDDEHDNNSNPDFIEISDKTIEVTARMLVKSLEELIGVKLKGSDEEEDYVTVGGLILSMIGRVPTVDEVFEHKSGIKFIIKSADDRCIHRLIVDITGVKV